MIPFRILKLPQNTNTTFVKGFLQFGKTPRLKSGL